MEGACERECDAAFVTDFSNLLRSQVKRQPQRFETVGGAALRGGGTVTMLDDLHTGGRSHHGAHGGQIHGGGSVTAGTDDIGGFAVNVQWDGMVDHGLGRTAHLVRGQAQLLLGGEYRTHCGRIGVAIHQVINEPLGLLRA